MAAAGWMDVSGGDGLDVIGRGRVNGWINWMDATRWRQMNENTARSNGWMGATGGKRIRRAWPQQDETGSRKLTASGDLGRIELPVVSREWPWPNVWMDRWKQHWLAADEWD